MQASVQTSFKTSVKTSVNWVQTGIASAKLAAILAVALVASGCATPTGAAFTTASAPPDGQAQVYLYRKSALGAVAQSFSVQLNKQAMGELFNASYMRLTMAPGEHVLGVSPSAISKTYEIKLTLADKQTQYVEFELPPIVVFNAFLLGSNITPRTAEQGAAEMQGLKSVK